MKSSKFYSNLEHFASLLVYIFITHAQVGQCQKQESRQGHRVEHWAAQGQQVINYRGLHSATISPEFLPAFVLLWQIHLSSTALFKALFTKIKDRKETRGSSSCGGTDVFLRWARKKERKTGLKGVRQAESKDGGASSLFSLSLSLFLSCFRRCSSYL